MTDEATGSGDRGGLRTILAVLRSTWIIVLSILLLASIVFQLPWKIAALYSILLLGCIAVPRGYRRYFWASVGLIVLALTIWVFLPDDSQGWQPYVFERETEAFLAKYRVPDEKNAALIYEDLCRQWATDDPNEPNAPEEWYDRTMMGGPWRSEEHPAVAGWLDHHAPTLDRLVEATSLEQCFFERSIRDWSVHIDADLPPASKMRQLAFLLRAAGNRDWGEHSPEAAMWKHVALLRLGAHLSAQPEGLFMLTGGAIEKMALWQFNKAMIEGGAGPIYLDRVDSEVSGIRVDWRSAFGAILEQNALQTKIMLASGAYQINKAGQVRYSRNPFASIQDPAQASHQGYWQKKINRARVILGWLVLPSSPAKMSRVIDRAYERYAPLLDPTSGPPGRPQPAISVIQSSDWSRFNWDFMYLVRALTAMSEETCYRLQSSLRRAETIRRGTRAIVALCWYRNERRSWPQDLEAARAYGKDTPFTDGWDRPFRYTLDAGGFVLYSTGENGIDEKGEYEEQYNEDSLTRTIVADDMMIWPQSVAKPEPPDEESMERMKEQLAEIYGSDYARSLFNDDANDEQ